MKAVILTLFLLSIVTSLNLVHEANGILWYNLEAINPKNLNDLEKAADAYAKSLIPNIADAFIHKIDEEKNIEKLYYVDKASNSIQTEVILEVLDKDAKKFKLIETGQSATQTKDGKKVNVVTKAYGISDL